MPDDKSIIKKWKRREDVATMAEWGKDGRRGGRWKRRIVAPAAVFLIVI